MNKLVSLNLCKIAKICIAKLTSSPNPIKFGVPYHCKIHPPTHMVKYIWTTSRLPWKLIFCMEALFKYPWWGGGCQFDTTFSDTSQVNIQFWNFLTFPKYQKQNLLNYYFFIPTPLEGGTKKNDFFKIGHRA